MELVQKILLASAAMPLAFPPVMVEVTRDGKTYQEMHVDGGAVAQLFLYPPSLSLKIQEYQAQTGVTRERHAYIIRNGRLSKNWKSVERRTLDIAGEALSTMIYVSGINDLYRLYFVTQADGVDYNLAYIEDDFQAPPSDGMFDPVYMNALFEYGYNKGKNGYQWHKTPPFLVAR